MVGARHVRCVRLAPLRIEGHVVPDARACTQRVAVEQLGVMDEQVIAAIIGDNEPKAAAHVKRLDRAIARVGRGC